jgi:hypothetical protein
MDITPLLELPLLAAGQAQKHVTHNEALLKLDRLTQLSALSRAATAPPSSPAEGDIHIVPTGSTGVFAGQAGKVALFADGAWSFFVPREGWRAWVADEAIFAVRRSGAWQADVPPRLDGVERIGVNATAASTERLRVKSPSTLLDAEGGSHRLKINRTGATDTASLIFQTGYSGRAEIGLAGSSALQWKVSPDGATWTTALSVDPATGRLAIGVSADVAGAQGASRDVRFLTGGSLRWTIGANGQAETGGDEGSHFAINRHNDSGAYVDTPLIVSRSSGSMIVGGAIYNLAAPTTASGANVFMDAGNFNLLKRSTSSRRYKQEIEPMRDELADRVLELEPVWYRSTAEGDRAEWSYYGLIAEDVARVGPRWVRWGRPPGGTPEAAAGREAEAMRPDAVQYDRLVVPLLSVVRRQQRRLAELESRLGVAGPAGSG